MLSAHAICCMARRRHACTNTIAHSCKAHRYMCRRRQGSNSTTVYAYCFNYAFLSTNCDHVQAAQSWISITSAHPHPQPHLLARRTVWPTAQNCTHILAVLPAREEADAAATEEREREFVRYVSLLGMCITQTHARARVHTCVDRHAHVHACTHIRTHARTYTHPHTETHHPPPTQTSTHTHTHTHTHSHTHTHTHTHRRGDGATHLVLCIACPATVGLPEGVALLQHASRALEPHEAVPAQNKKSS